MKPIDANFSDQFLFPPALEDFVPADHPARFIREFVEYLVADGVKFQWSEGGPDGRPPYSAALLCRVWLYAYLVGLTSSRKVELACRDSAGMMWLAGMNRPDHNTLWRFWTANQDGIKKVFLASVKLACEAGMIGMLLHAVDGTKLQSRGSNRKAWHRRDLEKLLASLDRKITTLEGEIAAAGSGGEGEGFAIPERLANAKALRQEIAARVKTLTEIGRDHYNPHESDAEPMKLASGGTRLGYNGQVVVDQTATIIVAADLVTEAHDQGQLHPMLDQVEANLGVLAEETVADGGYNTEQTIVEAEQRERAITLAAGPSDAEAHPDAPYHASRFSYDQPSDTYRCPAGQSLTCRGRKNRGEGRTVFEYRSDACPACPVRAQCSQSKKGRTIERSPHYAAVERHRSKRRSDAGRARLKKRGAVVERVFANIKSNQGFVRFTVGSQAGAAAQWSWICTAHNLRILCARWLREVRSTFQNPALLALSP